MRRSAAGIAAALGLLILLPGPLQGQESDEARLRAMHARLLQAHRDGRVEAWMELEAREFVSVNGGRVSVPGFEDRRRGREAYLESATFTAYRDLREPLVRVSDDGTLGWLVAEVEVRGSRPGPEGEEVSFHEVWAWVELYEKTPDGWKMVGNAANRRPGSTLEEPPDSRPTPEEILRRGRELVAPLERLSEIRTLETRAACRGPAGPFTTRVLSHRDGPMVFEQSYDDGRPGLLAGVHGGRAWQRTEAGGIQPGNDATAAFLRSHEFLLIPLVPTARLSEPRVRDVGVFGGTVVRPVELTDVAGNPFVIHYAVEDGRPVGYTITNPTSDGPSLIQVELADWRSAEGLRLPHRLVIRHGAEVWHYEFTSVRVNSLEDRDFDPEALVSGGS